MRDSLDYPGAWARGSASSSDDKPEPISRVVRPLFTSRGPGFRVQHLDGAVLGTSIDPWLAIDRFWMSRPTFPPHPHAGFSAIGRVRQCGVELGVASGLHFQAALGVICSGCASSIIGVARAAMPSICM